jgi:hypothetical protein
LNPGKQRLHPRQLGYYGSYEDEGQCNDEPESLLQGCEGPILPGSRMFRVGLRSTWIERFSTPLPQEFLAFHGV